MNEYDLGCSVEHHFRGRNQQTEDEYDEDEYEENEKQRLLQIPKYERSLWCWICGFMLDPCDFSKPKYGVAIFQLHVKGCDAGRRGEGSGDMNDY